MPEDNRNENDVVETGEGNAGEPDSLDAEAARARWDTRERQPKSIFRDLQDKIGRRRRRGGPDLHGETEAREGVQEDKGEAVDPTEPDDD
jgi:hypothetical protein